MMIMMMMAIIVKIGGGINNTPKYTKFDFMNFKLLGAFQARILVVAF
jgi:hypothetical protein